MVLSRKQRERHYAAIKSILSYATPDNMLGVCNRRHAEEKYLHVVSRRGSNKWRVMLVNERPAVATELTENY